MNFTVFQTELSKFEEEVRTYLSLIGNMLVEKNEQYGDSALDPIRIFSKSDPTEQIKVRIDDKLSRIAKGKNDKEDTVTDLIGYLILLQIIQRRSSRAVRSEPESE